MAKKPGFFKKRSQKKRMLASDPDYQAILMHKQDLKKLNAKRKATRNELKSQNKQRMTIKRTIYKKKMLVKQKMKNQNNGQQ